MLSIMERFARPLLIVLVVWLLALSLGFFSYRAIGASSLSQPGAPLSKRPYIPCKKSVILPRSEVKAQLTFQFTTPLPAVPPVAPDPTFPLPGADFSVPEPHSPGEPLYLFFQALLL